MREDYEINSIDPNKRMKRTWMFTFFVIGFLMVLMLVITLVYNTEYVSFSQEYASMQIRLVIEKTDQAEEYAQRAFFEFKRVYEKYTDQYAIYPRQDPEGGIVSLDSETMSLIKDLASISEYSNGLYDYTLGNLALLYEREGQPTTQEIETAMEKSGFFNVEFMDTGIRLYNGVKLYLKPLAVPAAMDSVNRLMKNLYEKQTGYIMVERNLVIIGQRNSSADWMDTIPLLSEDKVVYVGAGSVWRGAIEQLSPLSGKTERSKYDWAMVISDTALKSKTAMMALASLEEQVAREYINRWSLISCFRYDDKIEYFNGFESLFYNDNKVLK